MVFGKALTHYVLCNNLEYALTLKMTPEFFAEEAIRTHANGVMGGPIHFKNFIDNPRIKQGSLCGIIQAISGGEHFKAKDKMEAEAAMRKGGAHAIIANAIGSTETTSVTHIDLIDCRGFRDFTAYPYNIDYEKNPVTCGRPIGCVKYKIVDEATLEEVAPGESGLLLVSGPTVMKGYYGQPEENEKVFLVDNDGTRWFNTGDIMCQTGANMDKVTFTGRKKRNFVCNVTNIYPEEVESLLLGIAEIREAVITKVPDAEHQYLPVYHISLHEECDREALLNKIQVLINRTLGPDALPGYIEYTLEPFRLTANGKTDVTYLESKGVEGLEKICR